MTKVWDWLKKNKSTVFLLAVILFLLLRNRLGIYQLQLGTEKTALPVTGGGRGGVNLDISSVPVSEYEPQPEADERLVVETSNMSLVVDDVRQKADQIVDYAEKQGGYMVSSSISQPEEAPFATIVVRLPADQLRQALDKLRGLAVKVTSENLSGRDVTDEYVDIEERLETLNKTKVKFEEILDQATEVEDILQVQQQLINLQSQIDRWVGRQQYLEKVAENAKLTVYLSTDEWSLPYAPQKETFRPRVIFKTAVRSLVFNLRNLAKGAIWLVVYSAVIAPIILVIYLITKKRKSK